MTWLPQGYKVPQASTGYMKFDKEGAFKFRILSEPVMGWEYWNTAGKPVRFQTEPKGTPEDIRTDKEGKPERVKHFWAFKVWNYEAKRVQILQLTQVTIQRAISDLVTNEDWGSPKEYDITVKRTDGEKVSYTVNPSPHKPAPVEAINGLKEWKIDLQALFAGSDPFQDSSDLVTEEDSPFNG